MNKSEIFDNSKGVKLIESEDCNRDIIAVLDEIPNLNYLCLVYTDDKSSTFNVVYEYVKKKNIVLKNLKLPKNYEYSEDSCSDLEIELEYKYFIAIGSSSIGRLLSKASALYGFKYVVILDGLTIDGVLFDIESNYPIFTIVDKKIINTIDNEEYSHCLSCILTFFINSLNELYFDRSAKENIDILNSIITLKLNREDVYNTLMKITKINLLKKDMMLNVLKPINELYCIKNLIETNNPHVNFYIGICFVRGLKCILDKREDFFYPYNISNCVFDISNDFDIDKINYLINLKKFKYSKTDVYRYVIKIKSIREFVKKMDDVLIDYINYYIKTSYTKCNYDELVFTKDLIKLFKNSGIIIKERSIFLDLLKFGLM